MDKNRKENNLKLYPPVVSVLGHVDHGKTTLLDAVRKTNIAEREHGGITQNIGASSIEVEHEDKKRRITFIDTPGHEAFSMMRGRGVQAADIVLLIVSAVDGVMPQTKESIALLKAAGTPFIVVLTKIDVVEKSSEKAKQQLLKEGISLEGYGGDIPIIEISAKTGQNIKELLELILLVDDLREKKGISSDKPFEGIIIESKLDPKAGPKATLVVKEGTVKQRDEVIADSVKGRVRSLINDRRENLKEATVGDAVEVLGFESVPKVGSIVRHKTGDIEVKAEGQKTKQEQEIEEGLPPFIICADTQGSLEAINGSLPKGIQIIMEKTGDIETSDVLFAKSIGGIILGFNVKIKPEIIKLAQVEKVFLKNYNIIYEMIDEVEDLLEGKRLAAEEQIFGRAKILASFPYEKTKALGISVLEGRIAKGDRVRLIRDDQVIGESHVQSVRQGKNPTSKVEEGQEAGVVISPLLDFTIGDMLLSHD